MIEHFLTKFSSKKIWLCLVHFLNLKTSFINIFHHWKKKKKVFDWNVCFNLFCFQNDVYYFVFKPKRRSWNSSFCFSFWKNENETTKRRFFQHFHKSCPTLHTVSTAFIVHCVQCLLRIVSTAYSVTAYSVHCVQRLLRTVSIVYSVRHTVRKVYSVQLKVCTG